MAAAKKSKTVKKVTEIPNASVKIEVEEKEDTPEEVVTAGETPEEETPEENAQEAETEAAEETSGTESSGGFGWKKVFFTILIVVPIGLLMFGGFLFFTNSFNTDFLNKEPEKTINLPETTPTPTEAEVNKDAYEIEVQNGSGIAGEAASVQELLEEEGFTVSGIGNADSADYTDSQILAGESVDEGFVEELKEALETRGPVKVVDAPQDQTEEVIVIVGSELSEPDASPTPELE